ncbi:hypothetical protein [Aureitalea marina]|uniref:MORN motif n=1 Tax=Aureitalea marina TaxID=930804 RepID=A0A2S7KM01_9FLAO|nr:hypothetical protein [Aureitalea marina]PQB03621.1 hypothetical protein BST85_00930 [Aureitalea marina]
MIDDNRRDVYLLADFKGAVTGDRGQAVIIARNVAKDFYLTNPKSFAFYQGDQYVVGDFSNINGSYVYYVGEVSTTYLLEGIRNYAGWGSRSVKALPYSVENTYWYRDVDKKEYGIVEKGRVMDYTSVTTAADGNDMVVSKNGTKRYRLKGYYSASSYDFQPVEKIEVTAGSKKGCVSGDCANGWGKYQYDNGYYDGFWLNSKRHGYGLYNWSDAGKYIGSWTNDKMEGYGVYIAENNDNIIGYYREGELNGLGITVTGDTWKQGEFNDGNLSVAYDFFTNNVETGCTAGDCYSKYGRYKWDNGDSFTGFFKNGKMHMGTYKFANGDKYSGMFNSNNQFHGMGRYFYDSGEYYGGNWSNGSYQGRGYYHDKDLVQKIGEWSSGQLVTPLK